MGICLGVLCGVGGKKKIQEVCLDDLEEKFFRGTYLTL